MDWLWLILGFAGLGILWLLIMAMEKLTERLKENDEARRLAQKEIAERTAQAENDFLENGYAKARARDYIENGDFKGHDDEELKDAIHTLSSSELIEAMSKRVFGEPIDSEKITASHSAFEQVPVQKKAVAKGEGVMPVKVKQSTKSSLSKSEQKMLKKIKQGD